MRFPEESLEWLGHDDFTICPNRALLLPKRPLILLGTATSGSNIQQPHMAHLKINRSKPAASNETLRKPILVMFLFVLACARSQADAGGWQPSSGHVQVRIWPGAIPDAIPNPKPESVDPGGGAFDVSQPTMTMYAANGHNTGAAIVVFPGGGYQALAMSGEGTEICDWLTSRGITCVLLKYRVPDSGPTMKNGHTYYPNVQTALQDAQRTLGLVRRHAAEWHVDPHKVGVIGFSAGGHLAAAVLPCARGGR